MAHAGLTPEAYVDMVDECVEVYGHSMFLDCDKVKKKVT